METEAGRWNSLVAGPARCRCWWSLAPGPGLVAQRQKASYLDAAAIVSTHLKTRIGSLSLTFLDGVFGFFNVD